MSIAICSLYKYMHEFLESNSDPNFIQKAQKLTLSYSLGKCNSFFVDFVAGQSD